MRITAIVNQKGGIGKTTVSYNLASCLRTYGKRVLVADLDAQCNLTQCAGVDSPSGTMLDIFNGIKSALKCITRFDNSSKPDIIPASPFQADADRLLKGRPNLLRDALKALIPFYDFCLLDAPPQLGRIVINALTASDDCIIPAQASIFSLQALQGMNETIQAVKERYNSDLTIAGIIMNMFQKQNVLTKQIMPVFESTAESMSTRIFASKIRRCIALDAAQAAQMSIFEYDRKSNGAEDFRELCNEYLQGGN